MTVLSLGLTRRFVARFPKSASCREMVPTSLVLSWMLGHVSVHCHHATDFRARRAPLWVRVFQGLGESRQEVLAHIRLLLGLRWIRARIAWQHHLSALKILLFAGSGL